MSNWGERAEEGWPGRLWVEAALILVGLDPEQGVDGVPGSTNGKEQKSRGQTDPGLNLQLIGTLRESLKPLNFSLLG